MLTRNDLKKSLKENIILIDGAMGTYFNHLHPDAEEAEQVNRTQPSWIQQIHKDYILAGADMIRTNTFAINHFFFSKKEVEENIVAAVSNAKCAVKELDANNRVYIAGSVGPIRYSDEQEEEQAFIDYQFICDVLYANDIRIFILETFSEPDIVIQIAKYLKETYEDVFVIGQFSINRTGYTKYGYGMQRLVNQLEQVVDLDAFGFNCGIGVTHMNQLFENITFTKDNTISVLPNVGYGDLIRGKHIYLDNPRYYASGMRELIEKGVNIIGGCCGTTPKYIEALSKVKLEFSSPCSKKIEIDVQATNFKGKPNPFIEKLNDHKRVYVVEIESPFNQKADKFLEVAYRLKENEVDLVTISDSPMARSRADSFEMGIYIANRVGLQVMPHVCCRDRNLIGLRSTIMGAHINGIRDMLIITGDPVARDDRNIVTGVFDVNSIKLMDYVRNMNQEMFVEKPFYYGGALNYAGVNIDAVVTRIKKKMDAGCSYFLTQPVYSDADIERVRELKNRTNAKIILGIMPLVSYKNAIFMKNEMPGIDVPQDIVDRYRPNMERKEAEQVAMEVSVEIGKKSMDYADGFYIMTPFNRVELVNHIVNQLREAEIN